MHVEVVKCYLQEQRLYFQKWLVCIAVRGYILQRLSVCLTVFKVKAKRLKTIKSPTRYTTLYYHLPKQNSRRPFRHTTPLNTHARTTLRANTFFINFSDEKCETVQIQINGLQVYFFTLEITFLRLWWFQFFAIVDDRIILTKNESMTSNIFYMLIETHALTRKLWGARN